MESLRKTDIPDNVYIPDLLYRLWKHKLLILLGAILGASAFLAYSTFFVTPLYRASVTLYVNNTSSRENIGYITQSDLNASAQLVKTYAAIILSDTVMQDVIEATDMEMGVDALAGSLNISSVNGTEVFQVTIQWPDPREAAGIVNAIAEVIPDRLSRIVKGSSVEVINYARIPAWISYPNYKLMGLMGFAVGMILVTGCFLLKEILDTRIKTTSDFSRWDYPLLVSIPDFCARDHAGYGYGGYGYGRQAKAKKQTAKKKHEGQCLLSADTPFGIQEAYNTLRTNIVFSSPDAKKKIIVVTSSIEGEGKSTTAINLALCFAQDHAKVLLMDCDLRLPSIAGKLNLNQSPGLTNLLLDAGTENKVIYAMQNGIHVMTSGTIPPNPTVVLGSAAMNNILKVLSEHYDYIILDTPPLETMPDASILSKHATDVVLVVRQNTSSKSDVDAVVRKLEFAKANILGFAFTCVTENHKKAYRNYNSKYKYYEKAAPSSAGPDAGSSRDTHNRYKAGKRRGGRS